MTSYDAGPLAAGPLCGLLMLGGLAIFWWTFRLPGGFYDECGHREHIMAPCARLWKQSKTQTCLGPVLSSAPVCPFLNWIGIGCLFSFFPASQGFPEDRKLSFKAPKRARTDKQGTNTLPRQKACRKIYLKEDDENPFESKIQSIPKQVALHKCHGAMMILRHCGSLTAALVSSVPPLAQIFQVQWLLCQWLRRLSVDSSSAFRYFSTGGLPWGESTRKHMACSDNFPAWEPRLVLTHIHRQVSTRWQTFAATQENYVNMNEIPAHGCNLDGPTRKTPTRQRFRTRSDTQAVAFTVYQCFKAFSRHALYTLSTNAYKKSKNCFETCGKPRKNRKFMYNL